VGGALPVENFRTNACEIPQQFISDDRMAFHDLIFNRVEASGLVKKDRGGIRALPMSCRVAAIPSRFTSRLVNRSFKAKLTATPVTSRQCWKVPS